MLYGWARLACHGYVVVVQDLAAAPAPRSGAGAAEFVLHGGARDDAATRDPQRTAILFSLSSHCPNVEKSHHPYFRSESHAPSIPATARVWTAVAWRYSASHLTPSARSQAGQLDATPDQKTGVPPSVPSLATFFASPSNMTCSVVRLQHVPQTLHKAGIRHDGRRWAILLGSGSLLLHTALPVPALTCRTW